MTVYAMTDTKKGRTGIAPTYLQTTRLFFLTRRTDYVMHLQADCRRRTTNSAVTVTSFH